MPKQPHIFLVEDDTFISGLISKELAKNDWEMKSDHTGETAFESIKENQPSLVLLDVMLPGVDGIEILGKLKADDSTKHIPVFMLSNLADADKIKKARDLGAEKYIVKATSSISGIVNDVKERLLQVQD